MTENYSVTVAGDHLIFAAAHFISFAGHRCESLHGHNYRAAVTVAGPLGPDWYVVDFIALTRLAKTITDRLDHKMLLATANPVIHVEQSLGQIRATYAEREWRFPVDDCVFLPIENTTAELLARYIANELLASMAAEGLATPQLLRVEVEEGIGVRACYEWQDK